MLCVRNFIRVIGEATKTIFVIPLILTLIVDNTNGTPTAKKVGYYDMSLGQGNPTQVSPITNAGHTPTQIFDLSAAELADIAVLFVTNPSNGSYGAEYLSQLSVIETAVQNGMTLLIFDRYVTNAATIVPGGSNITFVRNFDNPDRNDIGILDATSTITQGQTAMTLDGGNFSNHGFADLQTFPPGAKAFLHRNETTPDLEEIVLFSYSHGSGTVIYSTIPMDIFLAGGGSNPSGFLVLAENAVKFAVEETVLEADLSVTKDDGVTFAVPGQTTLTYSIVASNNGPSDAPSVTLTDNFPADLTCNYTSAAIDGAAGNTETGSGNLSEMLSLPAGSSVTYTVTCTIDAGATGTLSNTATVTASVADPVGGNNSATDNNTVLDPETDLQITKSDSPDPVVAGSNLTYTMTVTNNGPSSSTGATVSDVLPSGVTFDSSSDCAEAGGTVTCAIGPLSASASQQVSFTVTVDPGQTAAIDNTAMVSANETDPVSGNDSATESTTVNQPLKDFGDAPDPTYPTLLASSGASHVIVPGFFLGAGVDPEADGQPNGGATGDDFDFPPSPNIGPPGDEDGVTFTSSPKLTTCEMSAVTVDASAPGLLNAWVDYDGDGSWGGTGEQIFTDKMLVPGPNALTFTVPCTATPTNLTFARFRFSTMPGLSYTGPALNGEVEDYSLEINGLDFGDALDPTYPTLFASDGARHILSTGPHLGTAVDAEADGQPTVGADGDDLDIDGNDEDGVVFNDPLVPDSTIDVAVTTSAGGVLNAWVDFDGNGSWLDANEQIFTNVALGAGLKNLTFQVPSGATGGITFARFRFNQAGGLAPTGLAQDGEVEDYEVEIIKPECMLDPATDTNQVNTEHTVTVTVTQGGTPQQGVVVTFDIFKGPNIDSLGVTSGPTDVNGQATFTYTGGNTAGTDSIKASGTSNGVPFECFAEKIWGLPPSVTTDAVSGVSNTGATLNGTVNANNNSTTVTFEYGTTTAYGTTVTAIQSPVAGSTNTAVSKAITGLTPSTTYHYRACGVNAFGTSCGDDMTFFTTISNPVCMLESETDTNAVGTQHTVTVTVTENAFPRQDVTVLFEVFKGPNQNVVGTSSGPTDGNGQATFTYTSNGNAGTDSIKASGTFNGVPFECFAEKVWVDNQCTLEPLTDQNHVGHDHTVTATVTQNGNPIQGVNVSFHIFTGPNATPAPAGQVATDINGEADFTYTGNGGVGVDSIRASGSINGVPFECVVEKKWVQAVLLQPEDFSAEDLFPMFNFVTNQFSFDIRIQNTSSNVMVPPFFVQFTEINTDPPGPDVIIANADGGGNTVGAFYDYSGSMGANNQLPPNEFTEYKTWIFNDPGQVNFTFDSDVYATFQTAPFAKAITAKGTLRGIVDVKNQTVTLTIGTTTDVEDLVPEEIPTDFTLHQNYPNPFNPETTIRFALPLASDVVINIYNLHGQLVRRLLGEQMQAGSHEVIWDARDDLGNSMPSGVYLYRIKAGTFMEVRKLMLIR